MKYFDRTTVILFLIWAITVSGMTILNNRFIKSNTQSIITLLENVHALNQKMETPNEKTVEIFASRTYDPDTGEDTYTIVDAFELDSELYRGH